HPNCSGWGLTILFAAFVRLHPEPLVLWAIFHGTVLIQQIASKGSPLPLLSLSFLGAQIGMAFIFSQEAERSHSFEFFRKVGGAFLWRLLAASWLLLLHLMSVLFWASAAGGSSGHSRPYWNPEVEGLFGAYVAAVLVPLPGWLYLPLMVALLMGFFFLGFPPFL
ncbi:MAG: hypothetical protein ACP5VN_10730, partial [Acidobacteriota bacterium]